ncbi:MAG: hypothetical protein KGJ55_02415 [Gammaproteobacteria bacterium]|nr:hypothetical protein [Gammaproteobacteria bacterium]
MNPRAANDDWAELAVFPDELTAEIYAGRLRADAVPVRVHSLAPIPGLQLGSRLYVPAAVLERARALLAHTEHDFFH